MKVCTIEGCGKIRKGRGLCTGHYKRWKLYGDPNIIKRPRNKKVEFVEVDGCFVCTSPKVKNDGYPHIWIANKHYLLHRYLYIQLFGEIAEGLVVRHKCDNPACINPEHLELGTFLDNMNDRIVRGRTAKGEQNGASKLKAKEVLEIRRLIKEGVKQREIAERFGVTEQNICDIHKRRSWKHLKEEDNLESLR